MTSKAIRRLMRDIEEMDRNPLENVCATPHESDIRYWHGNCMNSFAFTYS
jgi:ubiquitin-protein ligase